MRAVRTFGFARRSVHSVLVRSAEEADLTLGATSKVKSVGLGFALEDELARLVLRAGQIAVDQALEADSSLAGGRLHLYSVGLVSETDTGNTITLPPTDEDVVTNALTGFFSGTAVGVSNNNAGVVTAMSDNSDSTYLQGIFGSGSYGSGTTDMTVNGVGFADLGISDPVASLRILIRFSSTSSTHTPLTATFLNVSLAGGPSYTVTPAAGSGIQDLILGPITKAGGADFTPAEINALTMILTNFSAGGSYVTRLYKVSLRATHNYSLVYPTEVIVPNATTSYQSTTTPGGVFPHLVLADFDDNSRISNNPAALSSYGSPVSGDVSWIGSWGDLALASGRAVTKIRIVVRAAGSRGSFAVFPTISGVTLALISGESTSTLTLGAVKTFIRTYEKSGGGTLTVAQVNALTTSMGSSGTAGSPGHTSVLESAYVVAVYA